MYLNRKEVLDGKVYKLKCSKGFTLIPAEQKSCDGINCKNSKRQKTNKCSNAHIIIHNHADIGNMY